MPYSQIDLVIVKSEKVNKPNSQNSRNSSIVKYNYKVNGRQWKANMEEITKFIRVSIMIIFFFIYFD